MPITYRDNGIFHKILHSKTKQIVKRNKLMNKEVKKQNSVDKKKVYKRVQLFMEMDELI